MKKLFALLTALLILASMLSFSTSAKTKEIVIDDTDDDYVKFYNDLGDLHTHELDTFDDSDDELMAFTWFQGAHLFNQSGHFAYGGAYCEVTFTGTGFSYMTQYRGPVGGYSSSAEIYIDGELVETLDQGDLNAENDTTPTVLYTIRGLENKEHVVKIVNTSENVALRLPFDYFKIWVEVEDTTTKASDETTKTNETKADDVTEAKGDVTTEAPATEESSDNTVIIIVAASAAAVIILVVIFVIVKKKK